MAPRGAIVQFPAHSVVALAGLRSRSELTSLSFHDAHTADAVGDGLVATIGTLPAHLRGSLTWDQGSEMSTHKSFTTATDMPVVVRLPG
ncbi:MAG: hypothetical protein H7288_00430 [Kineosporiaceae bacterium]|nr:hypothetical protein [Aeromicrobium sp.]